MKKRNVFWGIFFILATILLVASQLGSFTQLNFWSVLGTIVLVAIIIQSCMYRVWVGLFIPLALLYLIFQQPLGWPALSWWILIIGAILLSIAFYFLFKSRPHSSYIKYCHPHHGQEGVDINEDGDENHPVISVKLGAAVRYLRAESLERASLSVSLGSMEVYFDHVTLSPNGAEAFLDCRLGAIELFIPRNWPVINNVNGSMGGIDFKNAGLASPDNTLPSLRLMGNVSMGGVEVTYI